MVTGGLILVVNNLLITSVYCMIAVVSVIEIVKLVK
jgi:hypothetical protein